MNKNIKKLSEEQIIAIKDALNILILNNKINEYIDGLYFDVAIDEGMNLENNIAGKVSILNGKLYISPFVAMALLWSDTFNNPQNQWAMKVITGLLTREYYLKKLGKIKYFFYSLPFIKNSTLDKWVKKNEDYVYEILKNHYKKDIVKRVRINGK